MSTPVKSARNTTPRSRTAATVRERRRSARIESVTHGRVGELDVQVLDVSLDGVGFRSAAAFELRSRHRIRIGNGPMYLEGRIEVVSVRPGRDGAFDVGGVFV